MRSEQIATPRVPTATSVWQVVRQGHPAISALFRGGDVPFVHATIEASVQPVTVEMFCLLCQDSAAATKQTEMENESS